MASLAARSEYSSASCRACGPAASRCAATRAAGPDRACSARPTARLIAVLAAWCQAVEDRLAVEVVGEPRRRGAAITPAWRASSSRLERRGLIGRPRPPCASRPSVDVAAGDRRPLQQPDAFRGEPGQPAPQRLRDAGRDLGRLVPRALRDQQPGQLADEERVAAAALPQLGGDLGRRVVPAELPADHRLDVGRAEAGQGELLGLPGDLVQRRRTPRCPGSAPSEQHRARAARARARNPSSRSDGSSAQCRSSSTTSTGRSAARRRGTARPPRTSGTGRRRGGGAHRSAGPEARLQQPARLAEVGRRQAGGPQHLGPGPVRRRRRCPPSRTRAGPGQSGPASSISAASIAVLPMPASPLIIRNCPAPRRASSSTELAAASTDSRPMSRSARLMAPSWLVRVAVPRPGSSGPGRRAGGRGRTRPRPRGPAAAARRPGPSGSDDVAVFWETAFGVQARVETA